MTTSSDGSKRRSSGTRKALVVANEAVNGAELRDGLLHQLEQDVGSVFVVAPAMTGSGIEFTLGDVDQAIGPARERLERTLEELREAGIEADGEVGDSDPMQAIQDEIAKFGPDQILVVAHTDKEGAFAERGLLEQVERDLELPVTELVVDRREEPHVLDVKRTEAGAGRAAGWRPSGNMPPLKGRHLLGILVAVIGTLILGFLATEVVGDSSGADLEDTRLGVAGAAALLIALGMSLINLAHVVGLFLFQSVAYDGLWSRFLARMSLTGTPIAVAIVAVLALT